MCNMEDSKAVRERRDRQPSPSYTGVSTSTRQGSTHAGIQASGIEQEAEMAISKLPDNAKVLIRMAGLLVETTGRATISAAGPEISKYAHAFNIEDDDVWRLLRRLKEEGLAAVGNPMELVLTPTGLAAAKILRNET